MSAFEAYEETSAHYDATRVPVGSEIILGCLARVEKPLGELVVLDAGCGTGAYSRAIVDRVGRIEALDMSEGMLAVARGKLADQERAGRIAFHTGSIAALPFADASFDAVMINQVAHHLPDDAGAGYPLHREVVGEFARVLRPGGALVFNTCTHDQLRHAYWYAALIPEGVETCCARFAPVDVLAAMFADAGLEPRGCFVPADAVCQGEAYFDGRGPLSKPWRDGDSIWATVEPAELYKAQARLRALDANGGLDAFVAENDARRAGIGQITFLFATRRAA